MRAIAFDLMDTVLEDPFRDALREATGLTVDELSRRRDPEAYPAFERGEIDEAAYWTRLRERGIVVDERRFHEVRRSGTRFLPGMAELLDDLSGVVIRSTASNYPVWVEELATGLISGRFEHVVASCHLGVRKPDPEFFTSLAAMLDCTPRQVAFVDDRRPNVDAAHELGMPARCFRGAEDLRRWLAGLGVGVVQPRRGDPRCLPQRRTVR